MIRIIGLKDFGSWLRRGEKCVVNNNLGFTVINRGLAKFLGYVDVEDKRTTPIKEINRRLRMLKRYKIPLKSYYSIKQLTDIITKIEMRKLKK